MYMYIYLYVLPLLIRDDSHIASAQNKDVWLPTLLVRKKSTLIKWHNPPLPYIMYQMAYTHCAHLQHMWGYLKAYSETHQTSRMELSSKIVNHCTNYNMLIQRYFSLGKDIVNHPNFTMVSILLPIVILKYVSAILWKKSEH